MQVQETFEISERHSPELSIISLIVGAAVVIFITAAPTIRGGLMVEAAVLFND